MLSILPRSSHNLVEQSDNSAIDVGLTGFRCSRALFGSQRSAFKILELHELIVNLSCFAEAKKFLAFRRDQHFR
jgi:hypothetical protein